jgi:CSLREA domain-containing protein
MTKVFSLRRITAFIILLALSTALVLSTPSPVSAANIEVNTTDDVAITTAGVCSLRQAILSVNERVQYGNCTPGNGQSDTIILEGKKYTLKISGHDDSGKAGDLDILRGVTIRGAGPSTIIEPFDTNYKDRIFHIKSATPVFLESLVVSGGVTQGDNINHRNKGGAILNDINSVLALKSVTVKNSKVLLLSGSGADPMGGGIFNQKGARLFIYHSVISGNSAKNGGGIYNSGNLAIDYSLMSGNTASATGGAIDNRPLGTANTYITNSTITGNTAPEGAGIASTDGMAITHNTFADNKIGSALHLFVEAQVTMRNTILAGNPKNCTFLKSASIKSLGYNLVDKSSDDCLLNGPGEKKGQSRAAALDAALKDNGGLTETFSLPAGSQAINAIPQSNCILFDQRMKTRYEAKCDIGAYEDNGGDVVNSLFLPVIVR